MKSKSIEFNFPLGPIYLNCGYNNAKFVNDPLNNHNNYVILFLLSGDLRFIDNNTTTYLTKNEWYIKCPLLNDNFKLALCTGEYFFIEFINLQSFNHKLLNNTSTIFPLRGKFNVDILRPLIKKIHSIETLDSNNKLTLQKQFLTILEDLFILSNTLNTESKKVDDIISYIKNNYTKDISLDDLSIKFNYTKNYIISLVKSHYNMTPIQYIQHLRIEEAKKLLINTNLHLIHISLDLGYSDVSLFFRAFKKHTGVSPSIWRKANKPNKFKELTF